MLLMSNPLSGLASSVSSEPVGEERYELTKLTGSSDWSEITPDEKNENEEKEGEEEKEGKKRRKKREEEEEKEESSRASYCGFVVSISKEKVETAASGEI